ncbi:MAG TPA: MFS transporter [Anaerolineaceae bacterium]|nr:MFS transporter [Anaerolineaceae bacterium]
MKIHPLFHSLVNFKGNARGCVYPEPLNAIPVNLYAPYVSVFMLALGVTDAQIGLTVSVSWAVQLILAIFSGTITDKLGRRKATLIFDLVSYVIPAIISAAAQNFWYFLGAAIFSSFIRIPQNSWMCLAVEDTDPDQLIDIFSWVYIAGLLSAFFAPIAGLLIKSLTLIPTMRILYIFAAICFTAKAFITYHLTSETKQGFIRMEEMKRKSIFSGMGGYRQIFNQVLHTPKTLYTAGIMVIMSICLMINSTFWSVIVTEKIKIAVYNISIFAFVHSVIMLVFYFVISPRLKKYHYKIPMVLGFWGFALSQLLLILTPINGYFLLIISIVIEGCALATLNPLVDQLIVLTIDAEERARIQSILYVAVIIITTPFGWIAGNLSAMNKSLPFILNLVLFGLGGVLAWLAGREDKSRKNSPSVSAWE